MPFLNRQVIGKTYEAYETVVEAHETIFYALATNDPNPAYTDGRREGGIIAPPMYAVAYAGGVMPHIFFDDEIGDGFFSFLVHGEQEMEWLRAVRPEQRIRTVASITDIEDKGTGELLSVVSRSERVSDGAPVCVQHQRFFVRGYGKLEAQEKGKERESEQLGEQLFQSQEIVHAGQPYMYAEPSGDHNPIHKDDVFAQQVGLGGIILQGLCTMAFCHKALVQALCGGDPLRLTRCSVRFSKPVRPSDLLTITGWALPEASGEGVAFAAANQRGEAVIKQGRAWLGQVAPR
jgi:acyl dehydratase